MTLGVGPGKPAAFSCRRRLFWPASRRRWQTRGSSSG